MRITYLGHAGFCVETAEAVIVMDPWLSPYGAFDSGWFQFPRNHHLASLVETKLADPTRARFLYISHEHNDHFDPVFLHSLRARGFTVVIGRFKRRALEHAFAEYACAGVVVADDQQEVPIPGGSLTLFVDDTGLNRDCGILVDADGQTFLNINDCKIYDRLSEIVGGHGPIDVFACQFSGATWHPTCYQYPRPTYERISRAKMYSKFESVTQAIETVQPRMYLPSAGPPCFLDPDLMHLNFEPVNIFPRAPEFITYLNRRLPGCPITSPPIAPGDVIDVASASVIAEGREHVPEEEFEHYVRGYAAEYREYFADLRQEQSATETDDLLDRLRSELLRKVRRLRSRERMRRSLFFALSDVPGAELEVDFLHATVERVSESGHPDQYYRISAPRWALRHVLDGFLTWEEFSLSFRARLEREPDLYQTLLQGFLILEAEDLDWFSEHLISLEERGERTTVTVNGRRFSIGAVCPHQGGDLRKGWPGEGTTWTCPRHGWQFDLDNAGRCTTNETSIDAVALEDD